MQPPTTEDPDEPAPGPLREGALRRLTISFLLVVVVGWAAYMIAKEPAPPGRQNLIDVSVMDMNLQPAVVSTDAAVVEEYIHDLFGARVRLPSIRGATLAGAASFDLRPDIEIPVVLIDDPQHDINQMIAITYALLDTWASNVYLDRSVRLELEDDNSKTVVTGPDGREVVLWRSGDDIFVAVAQQGASRLIKRIKS